MAGIVPALLGSIASAGGLVVGLGSLVSATRPKDELQALLALQSRTLNGRTWNGRGFIGSIRNRPPAPPPSAPPTQQTPQKQDSSSQNGTGAKAKSEEGWPIGGATSKKSPPTPFSLFRNHKPPKLPKGAPRSYDPSTSP